MASRAHNRLIQTRNKITSVIIVLIVSAYLYMKVGSEPAFLLLASITVVGGAIVLSDFLIKNYIWKTKLGEKLGYPPNYSGTWVGEVVRTAGPGEGKTSKVEVTIIQEIENIQWHQKTYDEEDLFQGESHFVVGEVIDEHRKWDGIWGVYEVARNNGQKDTGVSMMTVSACQTKITGNYAGLNNHVGVIKVEKRI